MNDRGLKIGGRIDRYVSLLFVSSYATAFFIVVGLFLVLDMAQNLDEYVEPMKDGSATSLSVIARFYLLNIPFLFLQVGPFVTLVAGLFTVSKLLKHNETIAVLAAGVSAQRLLAPVFLFGALAAAGMFGLREALVSTLGVQRDALHYVLDKKTTDQVYPELWLKDLKGSFVHLIEFRPNPGGGAPPEVRGFEATLASPAHLTVVTATRAEYVIDNGRGTWMLENGVRKEVRTIGQDQHVEPVDRLQAFDFTPALAITYHRKSQAPLDLSFHEAKELAGRDPDNVLYQTLMQYYLTFPLGNLVLLLVGLPILLSHERRRGPEGLAAACILCIFYFAADFVFRNLGSQGALDPALSAWLPILFFGAVGIALFDSMRT